MQYRFIVGNSLNRQTVTVDGNTTVRKLFADAGVELGGQTPQINGKTVATLDASIDDLGLNPNGTYRAMAVAKAENAVSAVIHGATAVVTSSVKLEDIKMLEKYAPEKLALYDEDNVETFSIKTTKDKGSLSMWGAEFSENYATSEGKATITIDLPEDEDAAKYVEEMYGAALLKINDVEANFASALAEVNAKVEAIKESITVE